ncbi:hypothetical protein UPYG_G00233490 [Umbra pygmaea]|uniref:Uncharacterized protein n=1 Tax=Umbra pygmaea TaxID=75934 RepID=A0ABD0X4F9_UMBPY
MEAKGDRRRNECVTLKKYPFLKTPSGLLEEVGSKQYLEAREETLIEDLPGMDFRAALIFLPIIFKESLDHHIMMGEGDPNTPYPIVQVSQDDWKSTFGG